MKRFTTFALSLLLAGSAFGAGAPTFLRIKILQNGETLAAPSIIVEQRIAATIELDERVRLEVRAQSDDRMADTQFKLFLAKEGKFSEVAAPRMVSELNKEAAFEVKTESGETLRFVIIASTGVRSTGDALDVNAK